MANTVVTPSMIAKEALFQLKNNLIFSNQVYRQYEKEFTGGQGSTVSIRKPVKFVTSDGATRVNQDVEEKTTSIVVDQRKHVSWNFSTQDLTLSIEEYSKRYIQPAVITLAQTMDAKGYDLYKAVWNAVGTPGTTPSNFASVAATAQRLDEMAVPPASRSVVLNPAAAYAIAGNQTTLAAWDGKVKSAYEAATLGPIANLMTYSSQNIKNHTVGTKAGTPLVNGAAQNVTYANSTGNNTQTIITDGWTASSAVLKAGDIITFANTFAVNPVPQETSKTVLPYLQQFVVINDVTADGTGNATLTISPAIITSGPYQTVSAAPADNAAITVLGTASTAYPQNMAFHTNAFALVTVPLEMPDGAAFKARENADGLSIRVIKDYDISADVDIIRLDILYGWKAIYPDLAARLFG